VIGLMAAALGAFGVYLIYTSVVLGWRGSGQGKSALRRLRQGMALGWLEQAGLDGVGPAELAGAVTVMFVVGAAVAYAVFGGALPALVAGCFAASAPFASYRARRARRVATAREAWPRLLEELRLLTGSLGRSIPQALLEVGRRAPAEMRPAFVAAEREWLLTTDLARTLAVLQQRLADPTVDTVAETLIVAHEVGGADLDRRLVELIEDRALDLQGRKDAASKQAGVRFARRFVLLVPLGMTAAGLSIGTGRSAYQTSLGQLGVVIGLVSVVACWVWSARLMRLPEEPRVLRQADR